MPILFNNNPDSSNDKKPEEESVSSQVPSNEIKNVSPAVVIQEDDFAIFPQWDVVPPNSIINPRLKNKI